jgi:hypothetical protein
MEIRRIYGVSFLDRLGIAAIVLYPFILFADHKPTPRTMRHEDEHVRQIRTFGFFSFYLSYGFYYLAGLVRFRSHAQAYWFIPYEVEAREAETNVPLPF